MSILRTGIVLLLVVLGGAYELQHLNQQGLHIPLASATPPVASGHAADAMEAIVNGSRPVQTEEPSGPVVTKSMPLSDGPRVAPVAKMYASTGQRDAATIARYKDTLSSLEIDACFHNGTFAAKVDGSSQPVTVHSGEILSVAGMPVTLKLIGYPSCRVQLIDGKQAFGEVAAL